MAGPGPLKSSEALRLCDCCSVKIYLVASPALGLLNWGIYGYAFWTARDQGIVFHSANGCVQIRFEELAAQLMLHFDLGRLASLRNGVTDCTTFCLAIKVFRSTSLPALAKRLFANALTSTFAWTSLIVRYIQCQKSKKMWNRGLASLREQPRSVRWF